MGWSWLSLARRGEGGGAAGGSCCIHPLLWCWSNLRCAYGWCLTLVTAVLYYLGNFPDVFPTFDLLLFVFVWIPSRFLHLVYFLLHRSNRLLKTGWGCAKYSNGNVHSTL
jgi:hypothetical protein